MSHTLQCAGQVQTVHKGEDRHQGRPATGADQFEVRQREQIADRVQNDRRNEVGAFQVHRCGEHTEQKGERELAAGRGEGAIAEPF